MTVQKEKPMNELPVMLEGEGIMLFYPHIPKKAIDAVTEVLSGRWIGQGPRVAQFEKEFGERFGGGSKALAVGSGTDALHLAYILAGLNEGDEVITPVFTCTATTIPFLYMGVHFRFADVDPETLNINVEHVRKLVNEKTKAIVCVHYGGLPCDMDELLAIGREFGIPVIEDAAHAVEAGPFGEFAREDEPEPFRVRSGNAGRIEGGLSHVDPGQVGGGSGES